MAALSNKRFLLVPRRSANSPPSSEDTNVYMVRARELIMSVLTRLQTTCGCLEINLVVRVEISPISERRSPNPPLPVETETESSWTILTMTRQVGICSSTVRPIINSDCGPPFRSAYAWSIVPAVGFVRWGCVGIGCDPPRL